MCDKYQYGHIQGLFFVSNLYVAVIDDMVYTFTASVADFPPDPTDAKIDQLKENKIKLNEFSFDGLEKSTIDFKVKFVLLTEQMFIFIDHSFDVHYYFEHMWVSFTPKYNSIADSNPDGYQLVVALVDGMVQFFFKDPVGIQTKSSLPNLKENRISQRGMKGNVKWVMAKSLLWFILGLY